MDTRKPNLAAPCTDDTIKVRPSDQQNDLNATLQDRDAFNSEGFSSASGPQVIFAYYIAGQNTPERRTFDISLPRNIETGIHSFDKDNPFIQIDFTEFYPDYTVNRAIKGVINLFVNAEKGQYSGTLNVVFNDPQNRTFTSEGEFSFTKKL